MKLFAETDDTDFFRKAMHELGTTVYTTDEKGNINEVVYFSGSRVIKLTAQIPEDLAKIIKAEGHKFNTIEIDDIKDLVILK